MKPITLVILGNIALVAAGIVIKSNALTKSKETSASAQPEILILVDTTPITLGTAKELRAKSEPRILVDTTPITMDTVRELRAKKERLEEKELLREKKLLAEELAAFSREFEAAENQQQASSESTQTSSDAEQTLRDLLASADDDPDRENKVLTALLDMALEDPAAAWKLLNDEYAGEFGQYEREQLLLIWFDQDPDAALPEIETALNSDTLNPEESTALVSLYTSHLAQGDTEAAFQWAASLSDETLREQALMSIFYSEEDIDAASMIGFLEQLSEEERAEILPMASHAIASQLVIDDPLAALDWAEGLPENERREAQQATVSEWVQQDPATATDWLTALPDSPENADFLRDVTTPIIYSEPEVVKVLFEKMPEDMQYDMLDPVLDSLQQQGPGSAEQWLAEQSNPELQHRGSVLVAMNNPAADTYETLDNIGALASGEREQLLFEYYEQQVLTDRDTTIQWLQNTSAITPEEREMLVHITNDSSTGN